MANVRRLLLPAVVAASFCISFVGYCRDGSIPLLDLISRGTLSPAQVLQPLPSSARCNCSRPRDASSDSATKFVSQETAVEKLVPLSQLRKKIDFSRHDGLSLLDHRSLNRYYLCAPSTKPSLPAGKSSDSSADCRRRRFLACSSPLVALASSPGSGNTWLRYLLEQTSGVFTGSIYCDHSLKTVFPGEHIVSGSVLVVKTHRCDSRDLPDDIQEDTGVKVYDRAVVLVRNPFDALVSEANRRWNSKRSLDSHVGLANEMAFIGNPRWNWYVETKTNSWGYLLHSWLNHAHFPVHVVQYERLVNNTRDELVSVLTFLDISHDNNTLDCAIRNGNHGNFKRAKHLNFDPFSNENKAVVNHVLKQVAPILARHGIMYKYR